APAIGRLGANGPRLTEQIAVVEARQATRREEKQPAAHLDQLGIADVPIAGEVVRVQLAQSGERPAVIARLEDLDARARRSDLAFLAAAKHKKAAAVETDHPRVLVVQPVRVDDSPTAGEADTRAARIPRA